MGGPLLEFVAVLDGVKVIDVCCRCTHGALDVRGVDRVDLCSIVVNGHGCRGVITAHEHDEPVYVAVRL